MHIHPSMASPNLCVFFFLIFFAQSSMAKTSVRPPPLVLPVIKDPSTLQYITQIKTRTPLVPTKLAVDLGGRFMWVNCVGKNFTSSSYRPVLCNTDECKLAKGDCKKCSITPKPQPGCHFNTCYVAPDNTIGLTAYSDGEVGADVISLQSINGRPVSSSKFLFSCCPVDIMEKLASGVKGIAGLGKTRIALPFQFAQVFQVSKRFALCLSSSSSSSGVIFFGDGPYQLLPKYDVSKSLVYTPLVINPVSTSERFYYKEKSIEYFIGVKSIEIKGKAVALNATLLSIDKSGNGGTKLSTIEPYTIMETSIYKAVTGAFVKELGNVRRVRAVSPFGTCFSSEGIVSTRTGPGVPTIDLVLLGKNVKWRIWGANSIVSVNKDVMCLGFIDGGENLRTSIVIGGHQLEDNLIQFDVSNSRIGFTSSLLFQQTKCSNFNFSSASRF